MRKKIRQAFIAGLAVTIGTALARRRLRSAWRWIHRVNYIVFAAVLVHGLMLGPDLAAPPLLRTCSWVYAAVVATAFVYRLALLIRTAPRPTQG